jgi:hypothetical protein
LHIASGLALINNRLNLFMKTSLPRSAAIRNLLFSEKEWAGYIWLLKVLAVYFAAGIVVTLLYEYSPARQFIGRVLFGGAFPVYVLVIGLVLGVPAFNLCKASVERFPKGRALSLVLLVIVLFCIFTVGLQFILPRVLPVFSSVLVLLLACFLFLLGCRVVIRKIVADIRGSMGGK